MSNDIKFFDHDTRSRHDPKLQKMIMKEGINGNASVGIFWCVIEMLHEEHGTIMLTECERIAFELRVQPDFLSRVLWDYELFEKDETFFWSNRVKRNLGGIYAKSQAAKKSAEARWNKNDANALRTQSEGNAKGKERKGKEFKGDIPTLNEFLEYCKTYLTEEKKEYIPYETVLKAKYNSWAESKWVDGHDKKIKNWKTKIQNTIPYLMPDKFKIHSEEEPTKSIKKL